MMGELTDTYASTVGDADPFADPIIRLRDISVQFRHQAVLQQIDLDIHRGETLAIDRGKRLRQDGFDEDHGWPDSA